jgi:beta-alanine--pyruvate transaminase
MPGHGLDQVFFTMCGSTAVDTALKIALAYHKVRGEGGRYRLIGRERAYHGVGFGGISVGGILPNRRTFGPMLPGVDHMRTTYDREHQAFSKGEPEWGLHLAEDLERLVNLHDASTIAAVIVEPVSGSAGVLVPPVGYLRRLREICDKHGILLIFDEVITAFGRLGKGFGAEHFGVVPDMITCAKGLTNAVVPAGATFVQKHVYDTFMNKTAGGPGVIELFHGYTYSGHPLAMAAGLATLDVYKNEGLFERAAEMAPYWQEALHSLKGHPHVIDIRNLGLMGAVELAPRPGKAGERAFQVFTTAFHKGVMVRVTGETLAMSPPLIIEKSQIDKIVSTLSQALHEVA